MVIIINNTHFNCSSAFQSGVRDKTNIYYKTSLGVIFGVKKYAERLEKIAERK